MKIYTKEGDCGITSALNGEKLSKNSNMINFIGTLDELNSHLGLVKAILSNEDSWQFTWKLACKFIERVQNNLMKLMSHASDPKNSRFIFGSDETAIMEKEIDRLSASIPKVINLIIPGKNIIEAQIQITRTIARRAERLFFTVNEEHSLNPNAGNYLNRLSDYLFVLSQQESLVNVDFINQLTGI